MQILGKEIEFNFEEAENIDKAIRLDNKYKEIFKEANTLTEKCKVYKDFFDELMGKGISEKLFGNKNKFFEITDAYQDLMKEAERVNNEVIKRTSQINKKYERYK